MAPPTAAFHWLLVLLFTFFGGCIPPSRAQSPGPAEGKAVTQWMLVGPFDNLTDDTQNDPLMKYGLTVSSRIAEFQAAGKNQSSGAGQNEVRFIEYTSAWPLVDIRHAFRQRSVTIHSSRPFGVYAVSEIDSARAGRHRLLIASNAPIKIWINGEPVFEEQGTRRLWAYDRAVDVQLREGANMICVHLSKQSPGFGIRVENSALLANEHVLKRQSIGQAQFLNGNFFPDKKIVFNVAGIPEGEELALSVTDSENRHLLSASIANGTEQDLSLLPDDRDCIAHVSAGKYSIFERFYTGTSEGKARQLINALKTTVLDERRRLDAGALMERISALMGADAQAGTRSHGRERRVLWTLTELQSLLLDSSNPQPKGSPGIHLHGFVARDGSNQYYRVAIPGNYHVASGEIPVAIMIPTSTSAVRPYIKSVFMAAHDEAEGLAQLADSLGMAILSVGYRISPECSPTEIGHVEEVINDFLGRYAVDRSSMALLGACSAGEMALALVAKLPWKFTAVGLLNPTFAPEYPAFPNSTELFLELPDPPPICIVCDGADVGHGDLQTCAAFSERAVGFSVPVRLLDLPEDKFHQLGWETLLRWVKAQWKTGMAGEGG